MPSAGYMLTGSADPSGMVLLLRDGTLQIWMSLDGTTVEWPFVAGTLGQAPVVLLLMTRFLALR